MIWTYWDKPTPFIKKIKEHNEKIVPIVFLDSISVKQYISSFPPKFDTLIPQHQSDWIRLYLLVHYGGIWSDASIIYYESSKVYKLWEKTKKYDYVGFYRDKIIVENWWIASKKGGKIVTLWLKEVEKALEEGHLAYYDRISKVTNLDIYNKDMYMIHYCCLQHVLQHVNEKIYLVDAYDSMLSMFRKCKKYYNTKKSKACILKTKRTPFIKLGQHCRKELNRNGIM